MTFLLCQHMMDGREIDVLGWKKVLMSMWIEYMYVNGG